MAEIGDALVDIQADVKKFAQDIEKIRAILESLDDKTVVIKVKLDKKSLSAIKGQLEALTRIEDILGVQAGLLADIGQQMEANRQLVASTSALLADNTSIQEDYLRNEFELNRATEAENNALRSQIALQNEITRTSLLHLQLKRQERAEEARLARETQNRIKNMVTFQGILGQVLARSTQLGRIRFDNFNELFGKALAGDTLLNVLGEIFNRALKVRRVAVQMGAALATAFAVGAQGAGALISGLAQVVTGLETAAGLGVIAIGIKLQLENADVAAAKDNLVSTFKEVGTRASESLREPLKGFFNDLSQTTKNLEPTFTKFFNRITPGFEALRLSINNTLNSEQFKTFFDKIGQSANNFLIGFAEKLPLILDGFLRIGAALKRARAEIRKAFGPGALSGLNTDSIVNGIAAITEALVLAGPGVRAFKTAFGQVFDAAGAALKGVLTTIGQVGPALFGALGPIASQAVTSIGTIASAFIRLASEVLPAVQGALTQFFSVFGDNFAKSIEGLAEPLSAVIVAAANLGTALAPLLPIFSQILANLDPIAVGFVNLISSIAPLAVAIGEFVAQLTEGIGPVIGGVLKVFEVLGTVISTILVPAFTLLNNTGLVPLVGGIVAVLGVMALFSASTAILSIRAAATRTSMATLSGTMLALRTGFTATQLAAQGTSTAMIALATAANTASVGAAAVAGPFVAAFGRIQAGAIAAVGGIRTAFATAGAAISTGIGTGVASAAARFPLLASAARAAGTAVVGGTTAARAALVSLGASAAASAVGMRVAAGATAAMGAATKVAAAGARLAGTAFRFMGGPITLVLIGIELLIAGFKGFMRILGGVIEILKAVGKALIFDFDGAKESFNKGISEITEGAKEAGKGIADHFTGGEAEGLAEGEGEIKAAAKSAFEGIKFDAAEAGRGGGQSFIEQFKTQFSTLDVSAQVATLEAAFKDGGLLAGNNFIDAATGALNASGRLAAGLAESVGVDQGLIDQFRQTGDAAGSGLTDALKAKLEELKNLPALNLQDAQALKSLGEQMVKAGDSSGQALIDSATATINKLQGKPQKAAGDAIKPGEGEAEKQGREAAEKLITTVTDALKSSSGEITASISLAFDEALGILPSILGPKFTTMLNTSFATSIATNAAGLSPQIVASMSLAFDTAFGILPGVLGPKISTMMSTAFATSIATSGAALAPQIVATMSLAFDTAFATLPGVLGPKISNMLSVAFATSIGTGSALLAPQIVATLSLAFDAAFVILPGVLAPKIATVLDTMFATVQPNGLALAATLQRVFTGAFNFAFLNLPAAIAPTLNQALVDGTNQGLQGFGLSIQGSINQAFEEGFSGVNDAVAGKVNEAFSNAQGLADGFAGQMGAKMGEAASNMEAGLQPITTSLPRIVTESFSNSEREAKDGMNRMKQAVEAGLRDIEGMAPRFYNAGALLGENLALGLDSKYDRVKSAAGRLAEAAAGNFNGSPAKWGPLAGKGDAFYRGQEFVDRLIKGLLEREPELRMSAGQLAGVLSNFRPGVRGTGTNGLTTDFSTGAGSFTGDLAGTRGFTSRIQQRDTSARLSSGTSGSNVLQIRPGTVNITVPGTDDPRAFINALSRELMTNCTAR